MTGLGFAFHRTATTVIALVLGIASFAFAVPAHADDSAPATRAARLTYLQGTVTVNQANGTASVPAQLNLPLLSGVQIVTAQDGQAEVEFEDGSVVRLTPNSALSLDALTVDPTGVFTTNLSLLHGLAYLELRATPQYRYWLNAGGDIVSPVENATVRVDFDQSPATFSVLDGTAHVERQNGFQADVRAGESLSVDADQSSYTLTQGFVPDTWDQWNEDLDQSAAAQAADTTDVRNDYAGAQGYGWSDLDADGTWYDVPGQGPVWQPELAVDDSGFDPYGYGSWVQYPGVGYLWASGYAWGWTPYRCGNWSYFGGFGWGWAPGASCGAFGWGFVGGGRPVNIAAFPNGYRPIRVPVPGRGPERPLIQIHTFRPLPTARPVQPGRRQIAGLTATPIAPLHVNSNSGGVATGSSLRRDYPVDSQTHAPVLGLAGTRPAVVYAAPGSQSAGRAARSLSPATPTSRPAPATSYSEPARPAAATPATRPTYSAPQTRPSQPRYTPPPSQPRSTPPPSQPRYAPPPSQPSAPRYTPPPSPPPAPRYTPPPPPPAPHYSAPPPSSIAPARGPR
jgi:hypothetical protein